MEDIGFLRNAWYVAAWSHEITTDLRQVVVLEDKICMFRTDDGRVVALEDACPHRKLPLSMGRRFDDHVECGYHGLTFDCSGQCVKVPGSKRIPPQAKVHAYPIEERYQLIWIWMGDPDKADPATIYPIDNYGKPGWGVNRGPMIEIDANYLHLTDNLLDPSHVAWVHQGSFGQAATEDTPLKTDAMDDGIKVWRWMMDVEPAPFYAKLVEFEGNCDRLQHYEVSYPCLALAKAVFSPAGHGGPDKPLHDKTFIMDSYNFFTPETRGKTRYYWFQLRNVRVDDDALSAEMTKGIRDVFEEDRIILNEIQKGIDNARVPPINLPIDGGAVRFRTELKRMIDAEAA